MTSYSSNFTESPEYTATYKACPNKEDLKPSKCILAISVGQPIHEVSKFEAVLRLVNATFKECTIIVCDSLQRHTLGLTHCDMNDKKLYKFSLEQGDEWLSRNKKNIDLHLTIPHSVIRWDHWLKMSQYSEYEQQLEQLYSEDAHYKEVLDSTAKDYIHRFKYRHGLTNIDEEAAIKMSLKYIKEECALLCLWPKYGYRYVVYPFIHPAMSETIKILEANISFLFYRVNRKPEQLSQISQSIIDITPAHIFWKDKTGTYLGANKAVLNYLGFQELELLLGKTDFDFLTKNVAQQVVKTDLDIMKKGIPRVTKEKDSNGTVFLSYKSPLRNSKNEIVGVIGNSIDITKQERAEQKLVEQTKKLQIALKVKEDFLNNISHELRTPLHVVSVLAEELYENCERLSHEEIKSFLGSLLESKNRLMRLVKNLLTLAKNKQKKLGFRPIKSNLTKIAQDVINEIRHITKVNLTLNVEPRLNTTTLCDADQISQVLRNLIDNAMKYGNEKDVIISITRSGTSAIKCSVSDQGIGVPENEKEAIFQPFEESSRTKNRAGGVGLGLAICREIIKAHKGKIWCENNKNGGATFVFTLPAHA